MDQHLLEKLIRIRRQLHLHPELGFREFNTSALVQQELHAMDIPFETLAVTGVIGSITKGTGPEIVLRADMDALPVREETGLDFSSVEEQVMHACGHDMHTTILLGAAALLKEMPFEGTVKLVFQPSEEGNERSPEKGKSGGQLIVESGKLNNAKAALGLHVHPLLPVGLMGFRNGEALANVCSFTLRITGKGGHAGSLEHVIDPVLVAGQIIVAAQSIISHNATLQSAVLAFTHMETTAPPSHNVIPQGTVLQGSLRAINIDTYNLLLEKFQQLLKGMETSYGCSIEFEQIAYYPSLLNDAGIHHKLSGVHDDVIGKGKVLEGTVHLVAEDFAFYSRLMPSQFYYLGAQVPGNDQYFLHHPKVTFNEACIPYGVRFLAEGALALIKSS
ncbi:M20 metallopeptidase family protein [Chitinophaga cymbidii]|uniref:N-acyl-L-amino acid amidohydrolase n=1 Tax=Chitinophaga cymbidii TaxID=1096750 RepID=A0A512RN37_9BACT|nr:M20 family metallopeptidase [Chitinophaga cymbidii]GEP97093.1 N-acyl-L-amino acid amidohydrolase [Chitinophaga cymbidii]